ncbi:MAG TPA: DUF790 family protein [Candidatus Thermoplasmatota archaeon]|nr:DUF790 family protein [Candidatus Thermoplasmatota archaeon]
MLPRDLLTTRRRGSSVTPVWADLEGEDLATAKDLVALVEAHVGRPRAALLAERLRLEQEAGTRFKLVRGLLELLDRRAHFEVASRVDPARIRKTVFETATLLGPVVGPETRAKVLAEAGRALGLAPEAVEGSLYADREENLVLAAFEAPDPRALLATYNLALAQTLLFDATRMHLFFTRDANRLFRAIKRHGLMHVATRDASGRFTLTLDGPTSLFRNTRRYGTSLAKVLPSLLRCGPWRLSATLAPRPEQGRPEEATFDLASDFPLIQGALDEEGGGFDSATEGAFAQAAGALPKPWVLLREPAILQAGDSVVIPDFGFAWGEKGPLRLFVEIVGFWTPEYLERKLAKVRVLDAQGVPVLLLVDEALACSTDRFEGLPAEVALFSGTPSLLPVARLLEREREAMVAQEGERIAPAPAWEEPILALDRAAARLNVQPATLRRAVEEGRLPGVELVGSTLFRGRALEELSAALPPRGSLRDLEEVLAERGVGEAASVLSRLGYTVKWRGLDPSTAEAVRGSPP